MWSWSRRGPANFLHSGGLEPGDVIHAINGKWIVDLEALRSVLDPMKAGDPVALQSSVTAH